MKNGIELIAEERQRQIEVEGFSTVNDQKWKANELPNAAACYAMIPGFSFTVQNGQKAAPFWPFMDEWWKPTPENRIRELQKAGALLAAEIDRLQNVTT